MQVHLLFPSLLLLVSGCSSQQDDSSTSTFQDRNVQRVSVEGRTLAFDQCTLHEETAAGRVDLYEFGNHKDCYLMEHEGRIRSFQTTSGTVIPLGIVLESGDSCKTSAYAIVYRENSFFISSKFYSRFQCQTFNWPEKPFHVLASDTIPLPSDSIAFEEAH